MLLDLYDTLARIDATAYADHLAALAHAAGVAAPLFRTAWDATGQDASLGRLATTEARARIVLADLGSSADASVLAAGEERFQIEAARLYVGVPEA